MIDIFLLSRIREDMIRRGALRPPGLGHMDPYLEAARRYSSGVPPPFSRKFFCYFSEFRQTQIYTYK